MRNEGLRVGPLVWDALGRVRWETADEFQAAVRYSLMRPPSLGCRRTRAGSGTEGLAMGWGDAGGCWSRDRWGRCRL